MVCLRVCVGVWGEGEHVEMDCRESRHIKLARGQQAA